MHVFVILPAAGLGRRMAAGYKAHAPAPKQFLELAGVPILIHTLRAFLAVTAVSCIYVAVRADERLRLQALLTEHGVASKRIEIVEGGETRQASVSRALAAAVGSQQEMAEDTIVLVHDAVRPLIAPALIERTIAAAVEHGAAIVGLPATDTIKQVERTAHGARVTATIPRECVVQAQTPQGFRLRLLQRALAEAEADGFQGTDEASLVERAGHEVAVVQGSLSNMKITHPGDLELAEFFLAQARKR